MLVVLCCIHRHPPAQTMFRRVIQSTTTSISSNSGNTAASAATTSSNLITSPLLSSLLTTPSSNNANNTNRGVVSSYSCIAGVDYQPPTKAKTKFAQQVGIQTPIICGAMYPCSNNELVAAASRSGGIGIIQPISTIYVNSQDLRQGIRDMQKLADGKPLGFNALIEASSKTYEDRMRQWVDIALEEGVRFFITALGNPKWVVEKAHAVGATVYHDVTAKNWAEKALKGGVDGLICVNNQAGGHLGSESMEKLYNDMKEFDVPLIAAGGVITEADFDRVLDMGYSGIQMGTRFIATEECTAHDSYKQAIVNATSKHMHPLSRLQQQEGMNSHTHSLSLSP
eukprot:TRINITY_DN1054_c0_g1_i2.p1 TRINITY_DN1054_c0_g1~~TRINITY_DN1054_c0_g1_i2.p1  ORF type:complete len:340 (+),score=98.13 TRINITY_DN1054_c0_g1_i2:668-1687(+)